MNFSYSSLKYLLNSSCKGVKGVAVEVKGVGVEVVGVIEPVEVGDFGVEPSLQFSETLIESMVGVIGLEKLRVLLFTLLTVFNKSGAPPPYYY